ncbi:hypothetical protein E3P86_03935 [Wallemia ichthyophaga]|uniref:Purple acid phosphatase n=1 Tax=Wallemia ichthyophaga TaxID=245174 RepID=A0A4V4M351_WALIC|nr:hypothetical protein E3P86_03935 [Wallemia ichthyophaga]
MVVNAFLLLPLLGIASAFNSTSNSLTYQQRTAIAPNGVNVAFNSPGNNTQYTPSVYYSTNATNITENASGESLMYNTALSTTHKVGLRNLTSDCTYYYQTCLNVDGECARSEVLSFKSAVSPGLTGEEFKFAVLGDMGVMGPLGLSTEAPSKVDDFARLDQGERSTMKALIENKDKYQLIIHNGDHAYADDVGKTSSRQEITDGYISNALNDSLLEQMSETYELILEIYFNQTSQFARSTPYMVGPGNHEQLLTEGHNYTDPWTNEPILVDDIPNGQRNFTFYNNRFFMPCESGELCNFWWSVEAGPMKFIQLNTETDLKAGIPPVDITQDPEQNNLAEPNAQIEFLEKELNSTDRSITPWLIVGGHRPWYGTSPDCPGCKESFEELLVKYDVDLVMHGHVHLYERLAPISNGTVDKKGLDNPTSPWYIINGAAGHYDGLDDMPEDVSPQSRNIIQGEFGYDEITIHNRTHLTHSFIVSKNDTLLDTQTLYKSH